MASGTIKGTTYISGHYWLELDWTDSTVTNGTSTVAGTSNVVVKTYFCSDWSASFSASKNGTTTINGTQQSWTSTTDVNHSNGSTQRTLVWTSTAQRVTHNLDGTKTITISGTYTPNITITGYGTISTMSASGSAVLNDVYTVTEVIPNTWVWTGTAWKRGTHLRVWDGDSWVQCDLMKAWTGSAWNNTK
jgi:hypothetical protein